MNLAASASMRPPTSKPNTSLHHCATTNSGYTTRRLSWAACCAAEPGACAVPGRDVPSRDTGQTNVVSTATWAPCQSGRPSASTSARRQSASGNPMFMSRKKTLLATPAPASRQTRAGALSRGAPRTLLWFGHGCSGHRMHSSMNVTLVTVLRNIWGAIYEGLLRYAACPVTTTTWRRRL